MKTTIQQSRDILAGLLNTWEYKDADGNQLTAQSVSYVRTELRLNRVTCPSCSLEFEGAINQAGFLITRAKNHKGQTCNVVVPKGGN